MENNEIVTDNRKNAEIINNYFVNIAQNLNIPESILGRMPRNTDVECLDLIDQILLNYNKHPSILKLKYSLSLLKCSVLIKQMKKKLKRKFWN